jgi:hypothetical protein
MNIRFALTALAAALSVSVQAATVNIDLSGASSGSFIDGVGADFTQGFAGQTVSGTDLAGLPSGPLTLATSGSITVVPFDPGVSAPSNSLLSQPGNAAPLAILLDSDADSFAWTMGSSEAGSSISYRLYGASGALMGGGSLVMGSGYNAYALNGLPAFRGISFDDNSDGAGMRFQNMSYSTAAVPEPPTYALLLAGLGLVGAAARRRRAVVKNTAAA